MGIDNPVVRAMIKSNLLKRGHADSEDNIKYLIDGMKPIYDKYDKDGRIIKLECSLCHTKQEMLDGVGRCYKCGRMIFNPSHLNKID